MMSFTYTLYHCEENHVCSYANCFLIYCVTVVCRSVGASVRRLSILLPNDN